MGQPGEPDFAGAKCAGDDVDGYYPERGTAQVTARDAKKVCNGDDNSPVCPARTMCLEYALDRKERFGIWGGKSERERAKISKDRRREVERQEREIAAAAARRKTAARKGWENRRTKKVDTEHAVQTAHRSKESSAQVSSTHPSKRRRNVA